MGKIKEIAYETNEMGCHLVTSHYKTSDGYIGVRRNGRTVRLHRWLYEQKHGKILEGLLVRHTCDNRDCINLEHLELGTHQDNSNDMKERKRFVSPSRKGAKNGNSKLSEADVIEILKDKNSTNIALAKKYGVTHSTISATRKRGIWKHIKV